MNMQDDFQNRNTFTNTHESNTEHGVTRDMSGDLWRDLCRSPRLKWNTHTGIYPPLTLDKTPHQQSKKSLIFTLSQDPLHNTSRKTPTHIKNRARIPNRRMPQSLYGLCAPMYASVLIKLVCINRNRTSEVKVVAWWNSFSKGNKAVHMLIHQRVAPRMLASCSDSALYEWACTGTHRDKDCEAPLSSVVDSENDSIG